MISQILAASYSVGIHNLPYCSFDICAIVLNIIVFINFAVNKKVNNAATKLFYLLASCSLLGSIFNLFCVARSVFYIPPMVCGVLEVLYALFYNLAGIVFFVYVVNMINENSKSQLWCRIAAIVLTLSLWAGLLLNALAVFGAVQVEDKIYWSILYMDQFFATVCCFALVILNRHKLRFIQRLNVYLFSAFNAIADVSQLLLAFDVIGQQVQLSTFALAVALLLSYVTLQRPEDGLDHVTGMFNIHTHLNLTSEKLRSGKSFFAYVFEICNMTLINTTFGIKGGNVVLKKVATEVRAALSRHLLLFRMSGARFAINFDNENEYKEFEPKFKGIFDAPIELFGTKIRISYIGCLIPMPTVTDKVTDIEKILKYYRSVATATDKVLIADKEAVEHSHRRQHVEYAIQNALKNGGFEVYYQPIYSVEKKGISSCEALIRLNDPEIGVIRPDEFIAVAEESGRIVKIGRFVMEEVCKFIKEERPQDYGINFIDVNLSVIQCMHPEILDDIDEIITRYDVPRNMVNLEITETASAKSYSLLQSRLNELRRSGFTISLDDFGSGFSSVEYLINFPFDIVKLDKSLVWAYMSTEKYKPILGHYMPMLHGLGLKIVAEGVENKEMLDALEELGCDYMQGYYFSRPIPKAQFLEYVKNAAEGFLIA